MYPDACRWHALVGLVAQVRQLTALHEQAVALLREQPQQRTFKLVESWTTIPANPHMHRSFVEPIEGIVDHSIYSRSRTGKSANIDDWKSHAHPPGGTMNTPC